MNHTLQPTPKKGPGFLKSEAETRDHRRKTETGKKVGFSLAKLISEASTVVIGVFFLCFGKQTSQAAVTALQACAVSLIPALFPFSVISRYLYRNGGHTLLEKILPALVGGFPIGADLSAQLCADGIIDRKTASKLAGCINHCGPSFLLGYVATVVFDSPVAGILLLSAQAAAVSTLWLFFRPSLPAHLPPPVSPTEPYGLSQAIADSVLPMLRLCGFTVFFACVGQGIRLFFAACALPQPFGIAAGIFTELSDGIRQIPVLDAPRQALLCGLCCGWGGLCVHRQSGFLLQKQGIELSPYYLRKALCALLQGGYSYLFFRLYEVFL